MTLRLNSETEHNNLAASVKITGLGAAVAAMSFFLNHTTQVAGFNLSFADPLLILALLLLATAGKIYIYRYALIFFVALVSISTAVTLLFTPGILGVSPPPSAIFGDLTKLIISLLYFIVGTSISRLNLHYSATKYFAIGAAIVAFIGLAIEVTGVRVFSEIFYYSDFRFRGFMSDPNFYALLSCAGLVYFAYNSRINTLIRWPVLLTLSFSVILSGSKTGMVTLIILVAIITISRSLKSGTALLAPVLVILTILLIIYFDDIRLLLASTAIKFSENIPQLERISLLLAEDGEGISGDGSARDSAWSIGIAIVQLSPIFGIGVGAYQYVGEDLFGRSTLAHNSYIQLAAEWGIILTIVILVWIFLIIIRLSILSRGIQNTISPLILREILIVFAIGSFALSLNNARMIWFFLGIAAYVCHSHVYTASRSK